MAVEFRGGIILNRRTPLHPHRRREIRLRRHLLLLHHLTISSSSAAGRLPIRRLSPGESPQQAQPRAAVRLVLPPPPGEGGAAGGPAPEMPPLRVGEDAAVEDGPDGPEDALQRLRSPVQVGPPRAGVPAGGEPDFRLGEALELAPEGDGAAAAEGCDAEAADDRRRFQRL